MTPVVFISAGEASGEHYGALLAAELRRQLAAAGVTPRFFGMGGERMEAAGLERVVRSEDMAVMGMTEVICHLPRIYGEFRKLKAGHARAAAGCGRADRLSRDPFQAGGGVSPAGRAGDFLCQPAALGVEEAPHQAGAEIRDARCW